MNSSNHRLGKAQLKGRPAQPRHKDDCQKGNPYPQFSSSPTRPPPRDSDADPVDENENGDLAAERARPAGSLPPNDVRRAHGDGAVQEAGRACSGGSRPYRQAAQALPPPDD